MRLKFEREVEDSRGKIFFFKSKLGFLSILEIKEGYARGGHYHKYDQNHFIMSGKVEILQTNIKTKEETRMIIDKPVLVKIPAYTAHLFIAHKYTIFSETSEFEYTATNYPKYRKIVEDKMK